MKKRIVLCADDYGQALAISEGILVLLQAQRLSATSCLVNSLYWLEHGKWLLPYREQIDIGLHFNLTQGHALSHEFQKEYGINFSSLGSTLIYSMLRQWNKQALVAELHAQIDRFEEVMGFLPNHIDGHQHIHQFPIVRDALLEVYEQRLRHKNVYIRSAYAPLRLSEIFTKNMVIQLSGGTALRQALINHQIPHNSSFEGIYRFSDAYNYAQAFNHFLTKIKTNGLILCHPGLEETAGIDDLAKTRWAEYSYFFSEQFLKDCERHQVVLTRFVV